MLGGLVTASVLSLLWMSSAALCPSGTSMQDGHCTNCPPGTFRVANGSVIQAWHTWPESMGSYCRSYTISSSRISWKKNEGCSPWRLGANGTMLWSGENKESHTLDSRLFLSLRFVEPGEFYFRYKVDSEKDADGLAFIVDGTEQRLGTERGGIIQTSHHLVSHTLDYVRYSIPMAAGFHILQWSYVKDDSGEQGIDAAFIEEMGWTGTDPVDHGCEPCPPGMTSQQGAVRCSSCTFGTIFNMATGQCEACPENSFALAGSSRCQPKPPCTESDYGVSYSPCAGGKRTKVYAWLEPQICDSTRGLSLPTPSTVTDLPCAPCPVGSVPKGGACETCPSGTYAGLGATECETCGEGFYAPKVLSVNFFYELPPNFDTGCVGDCGTPSWRLRETMWDSGASHGSDVDSWLRTVIEIEHEGFVNFSFSVSSAPVDAGLIFLIDDQVVLPITGGHVDQRHFGHALSAGPHSLMWIFEKSNAEAAGSDSASIHSLEISGVNVGGAGWCAPCPAGTMSDANERTRCTACPPGQASSAGGGCSLCAADTFAPTFRSPQCIACGNNTFSETAPSDGTSTGPQECGGDCAFDLKSSLNLLMGNSSATAFDLSPLKAVGIVGPIDVATPETATLWGFSRVALRLTLCSLQANASCSDSDGNLMTSYGCISRQSQIAGPSLDGDEDDASAPTSQQVAQGLSAGQRMSVFPEGMFAPHPMGVIVSFDQGGECAVGRKWRVDVKFICDLDVAVGRPVEATREDVWQDSLGPPDTDSCVIYLTWATRHGCPRCVPASYKKIVTQCEEGSQDVTWQPLHACVGGVKPADIIGQSCVTQIVQFLSLSTIIAIVTAGLVTVVTIIVLAVQYRRYRNLYAQYERITVTDAELEDLGFEEGD